jgi:hypothetical protein
MWSRLFVKDGGAIELRDVVVMVNGAVEPAATFTAPQAASFGNPEHIRE